MMVGASIAEASGEGTCSNSILSRKRQSSPISPTDGSKKRSTMQMDLEILECPICYEALKIPIFQCDNGHLACSSCCPKLSNKCPTCALPVGHSRNRAMENVLKSIYLPCPNAKFGCTENVSYGEVSTHVKQCIYSQCSCPALDCDYTGSYTDVGWHYYSYKLLPSLLHTWNFLSYNISSCVRMNVSDKIYIKVDPRKGILFAVQCFRELYGVCVTVSCIAPSSPKVGKFSYHISYTVDGHTMTYESPDMKRILEVSFQTPLENFMLIPHSSLRGDLLEMKLSINKVKSNQ